MSSWQNKVVLVTGASRGFGVALARAFGNAGCRVAINARGAERLEAAAAQLRSEGIEVLTVPADVTREESVQMMIARVTDEFGRLDVLVNNAGRSSRRPVLETTPEEFEDLMRLNLTSVVRCCRAAMPHLLAQHGHVVNIGSLGAKAAARFLGAYPATKFAVAAYSQQLRLELGAQGLHVLLVCPGPIARQEESVISQDELASVPEQARQPGGGVKTGRLDPDRLAEEVVRACEQRRPELVRPRKARLLFALLQLWPTLGERVLRKKTP